MISRAPRILGPMIAASVLLAGCTATSAAPPAPTPTATVASLGTLGAGFYDPAKPPAPEATISPSPDSWSGAHPPAGYSVVLLSFGDDKETRTLVRAVRDWAAEENVTVNDVVPASADKLLDATAAAIKLKPDLIISVGNALVDPLAALTPSVLDQKFLVVGAEIAEPTENVTAADWTGASYRGEGLGTPSKYDPATFTPERAGRALRAGIAAVLNDLTGIVVWVK